MPTTNDYDQATENYNSQRYDVQENQRVKTSVVVLFLIVAGAALWAVFIGMVISWVMP